MAGLELQRQLLKRLRRVVREWPSDPSRKGRDLGEFLKESYLAKLEKQSSPPVSAVAVDSLEKLSFNHYRKLYPRERELSFSSEVAKNPWILSNESLNDMQHHSRSLWGRMTRRRRTTKFPGST